jgi:DNA-binding NarL/FixJ family response regulator
MVCGDPAWERAFGWLLRSAGIDVVAHVRDVDRAHDLVMRDAPLVLLVDVDDGLEPLRLMHRIRELRHARPLLRVVVVCARGDNAAHDAALAGGADIVVRRENAFDLLHAIDGHAATCEQRPQLTLRELEVLRLVSAGHTNREVARALWLTEQTVKYHLGNIYRRLGVRTRAEAVAWAAEHGVIDDEQAANPALERSTVPA